MVEVKSFKCGEKGHKCRVCLLWRKVKRKMRRKKGSTCGNTTKCTVAGKRKEAEKSKGRRSGI